ncbi:MAG: NADH-quinone oxidoreductase subunit NuoH [Candidatus Hatepunaea meridiana]|nr:NADH-quinone oxidoreductase subunit NuoH [Candidatus Hatepunaea meridiana]
MNVLTSFCNNPANWFFIKLAISLIYMVGMITFVSVFALFAIWLERKISAWAQDRLGPMETGGFHGWLQTVADMLKLLLKEDIIPDAVDRPLFKLAPYIVFASSFAAFATLPFAANLIGTDLNIGIYYIVAISSLVVIAIIMAGWASNNKWSLFGAMRSASQMISYEVPVALALLIPILMAGSLSMQDLVSVQAGGFWNWTIFGGGGFKLPFTVVALPFTVLAFLIYFWASLAEVNRCPFDLPEGESEIIGFHVEYSAMRFGMFFFAEFANMFLVSGVAVALFLGGWYAPLPFLEVSAETSPVLHNIIGAFWFISKSVILVAVQMWLRWTLPRFRVDQLMHVCWKVFLPFSLANILIVSLLVVLFNQ